MSVLFGTVLGGAAGFGTMVVLLLVADVTQEQLGDRILGALVLSVGFTAFVTAAITGLFA